MYNCIKLVDEHFMKMCLHVLHFNNGDRLCDKM